MYKALYRKWRPVTFEDVCGQEHITSVLGYEIQTGKLSHAYLFCGSRGTGKTTCAKILAKAVNCEHPINGNPCGQCQSCIGIENGSVTDVIEMDAASNNGVDDVRSIRDEVIYAPSSVKYRVYIIDEVHMLSPSAFNALLKTLEEPPSHVIFILATTELQKLPATIISRCQRFDFRLIASDVLKKRLLYIAEQEGFQLEDDAASLIASLARGGMRDAISMLELAAGMNISLEDNKLSSHITVESILESAGVTGRQTLAKTVEAVLNGNIEAAFDIINSLYASSRDIAVFWQELIGFYRDLLVIKTTKNAEKYLELTPNEAEDCRRIAARFRSSALLGHCAILDRAYSDMQRSGISKRMVAEFALVKLMNPSYTDGTEGLVDRISALEEKVALLTSALQNGASMLSASEISYDVSENNSENSKEHSEETKEAVKSNSDAIKSRNETDSGEKDEKAKPEERRVLYNIGYWTDIIGEYDRFDRSKTEFLRMSGAYRTKEGTLIVRTKENFIHMMLSGAEVKSKLLSIAVKYDTRIKSVEIELCEKNDELEPIDELILSESEENNEENN